MTKQGDIFKLLYWFMVSSEEMKAESCFLFWFFFFFLIFIFFITVVPFPLPSLHSILPTPSLLHSPPIVHVHGSYLKVLWLLHFLHYFYPPPVYFPPIIYATYSLYLSPPLPLPLPYWQPSCSSCLPSLLSFLFYVWSLITVSLLSFLLFLFLIFFFLGNSL